MCHSKVMYSTQWEHKKKVIANQLEPHVKIKFQRTVYSKHISLACLWNVFVELIIVCPWLYFIFIFLIFIYLFRPHWVLVAAHGIFTGACRIFSCGTRALSCGMQTSWLRHADFLVAACMRDLAPDQGSNPGPLHWERKSYSLDHQGSPRTSLTLEATYRESHVKNLC